MRILIFGDSITQGFWDSQGGWVQRIRQQFDLKKINNTEQDPPTIFNMGVSGDSSDNIVARLEPEINARATEEIKIIFSVGVNDSRYKNNLEYSNTETYQKNLAKLLEIAQKYSNEVSFVGLTPCVDEKTNPVSWNDTLYQNQRINQFDQVLKQFCAQNQVEFIEIFNKFCSIENYQELLPDGLHPNDKGHAFIASQVKSSL